MITPSTITVEEAKALSKDRAGLVLGPDIATRTGSDSIVEDLRKIALSVCPDGSASKDLLAASELSEALDELANEHPDAFARFRHEAEHYFQHLQPSAAVGQIAKIGWNSVISLTADSNLEDALRERILKLPTQRRVTIVTGPIPLARALLVLPIFKLLGNCKDTTDSGRLALTKSERLLKLQDWKDTLASHRDYLRDGALVFLGTGSSVPMVRELLSSIYARPHPYPSHLLFSKDDPCADDRVIDRLIRGRSKLHKVQATEKDLIGSIEVPASLQYDLPLADGQSKDSRGARFAQFKGIAELVPDSRPGYSLASRRQEVWEALFRPNGTNWDPFLFDIELPRLRTKIIASELTDTVETSGHRLRIVVLRGEAAIGKTVAAKRLAVNLSRAGHFVFWFRKTFGEFHQRFRELIRAYRDFSAKLEPRPNLFVFCDDPWALSLPIIELAAVLDGEGIEATLVVVMRNSDRAVQHGAMRLPHPLFREYELEFELSPDELQELPGFLVSAGAASDIRDANRILSANQGENAADILCKLWYLLPDTREQLQNSLGDEYFRLESVEQFIGGIVDAAENHSRNARRAYEAVAVASGLGIGLPAEVLVNALQINYSDWADICASGRPLWGLLYPVENKDADEVLYYTRNEIVTRILLLHINGGVGHSSEVRVLFELVKACNGSGPVYRDFLIELLVRRKDQLRRIVSPKEGRQLYELALKEFPVPDRTLMHHFGKWVSDEEHDHKAAYEIFERALEVADYPYSPQEERREFIHTSMAAAIVQRVRRGEQDRETAFVAIKRHLRESESPSFFNLYTVHVQVNALIRLQQGDDTISLDCFVEAFRAIERSQQLAGASSRRQLRFVDALGMLENQKRELASSLAPFDELQAPAIERFELTGEQLVLEAAAIRGLIDASSEDKGSAYNEVYQFINRCQERVLRKKQQLSNGLRQVRLDLMVRWRLQHDTGTVDWNAFLGDIRVLREDLARRDDILLLFYEGVACFQLRFGSDAQAAFTRLRALQLPGILRNQARLLLRSKTGSPEQVQGTVVSGPYGGSVRLTEFAYDVPFFNRRVPDEIRQGGIVHCWIQFTLQGPQADVRSPQENSLLLPT